MFVTMMIVMVMLTAIMIERRTKMIMINCGDVSRGRIPRKKYLFLWALPKLPLPCPAHNLGDFFHF